MKKLPLIFVLALAVFSSGFVAHAQESTNDSITASGLEQMIIAGDAPFILDVRTPGEYAAGHIHGAVNIPHSELEDRLDELKGLEDTTIVLHCRSGYRAMLAEKTLKSHGFNKLTQLKGHMLGWVAEGYPVEKNTPNK